MAETDLADIAEREEDSRGRGPFATLDTDTLKKLRAQLRSHIPGDATHQAAVATLLGTLVDIDLSHRPAPVVTRSLDDDPVHTADGLDELDVLAK